MITVKVWHLPFQSQEQLGILDGEIVDIAKKIAELECKDEADVRVIFPTDMLQHGLGDVILVEIDFAFSFKELGDETEQTAAVNIGRVVQERFRTAKVLIRCMPPGGFYCMTANGDISGD